MSPVFGNYEDLAGKRVLITGGSAGIGLATAKAFAANGAHVCVMGRRKERLDAAVLEIGDKACSVVGDLCDDASCKNAVQIAIQQLGGLDVLVNNGGASTDSMVNGNNDASVFYDALSLHVTSAAIMIEEALEQLLENRGAVVNISSIASRTPTSNMNIYGVVKAAQDKLTTNLAFTYASKGLRFNSVLPGAIMTEALASTMNRLGVPAEQHASAAGQVHAMKRVGHADEVAAAILFLSSSASSFITGVQLPVDGGALLGFWLNDPARGISNAPAKEE